MKNGKNKYDESNNIQEVENDERETEMVEQSGDS